MREAKKTDQLRRACLFLLPYVAVVSVGFLCPSDLMAQKYTDAEGKTRIALVKMPYRGARNVPELSEVPDYLEQGGIEEILEGMGAWRTRSGSSSAVT